MLHPEVPFECFGHPKKCTQKVLVTLFPLYSHVNTKQNIVSEYSKTKIFLRDTNILSKMHWTSNIFGPSSTAIERFWVSPNYPILNFKKRYAQKMPGCSTEIAGNQCNFLLKSAQKDGKWRNLKIWVHYLEVMHITYVCLVFTINSFGGNRNIR